MKVLIEPYNPMWGLEFNIVRDQLLEILSDIPIIAIEHVGSTSIPGLLAKPVLDIDIIITPRNLTRTRDQLIKAGYEDRGEMGVPGRFAFRQPHDHIDVKKVKTRRNTYVVLEGCLSLRNHLDLKRVLLEDEKLRDEYSEVKSRLAKQELEDVDEYCRGKNEILLKILKREGWREDELEEVRMANE